MNRSSQEQAAAPAVPPSAQGLLFDDDLPNLDEDAGYRGTTVIKVVGITYRQLDYWARTDLVVPSIRKSARPTIVPARSVTSNCGVKPIPALVAMSLSNDSPGDSDEPSASPTA